MDFEKNLLREHTLKNAQRIADYVGKDPDKFEKLILVYLKGDYRVTQRASWPLRLIAKKQPQLIRRHLNTLINQMNKPGVHNAIKRNTLSILEEIEIPKALHGIITKLCFDFITGKEPIAIKAFAITVLNKICQHEPELKREFLLILEDQSESASPAIRVRIRRVMSAQT